ncbi:hypothetical protein Dda3937_02838 [Dickeya dadantii 3937]|uniref:Uncharacterized protein n=1 Tax=Dickeya dadantii (strain 3937) TaxID=198628 RepID=E0SIG6_DICD3|nr:hypothetical protein Dda3937_02838 [Dickeya dadantii 3937]
MLGSVFQFSDLYPSYFKLQVCWLCSFTRITYLSKLIGIHSLAAFLQLELFWVYTMEHGAIFTSMDCRTF